MNHSEQHEPPTLLSWHKPLWQRLTGRFPELGHGVLFYGKQGCGKQQFSQQFAQWILCQDKGVEQACGQCRSCSWFLADTHPQIKIIKPDFDEKKQSHSAIKIDQIRELNDFIQQTVEGWRIVMIYHADLMNIASANALLKTLEEPGDRVVIMLISDSILKLSATIRSRVQQFPLDRVVLSDAQAFLRQNYSQDHSLDANTLKIILALAENMPLKAQKIYESEWFKQRLQIFQGVLDLVKFKNHPMKFSVHWMKQLEFKDLLAILRYIIQDTIAYKLEQPIKQADLDIGQLETYYSLEQLFAIYQQINKIQLMSAQNVQAQLIFDELTMCLMNVEQRKFMQ